MKTASSFRPRRHGLLGASAVLALCACGGALAQTGQEAEPRPGDAGRGNERQVQGLVSQWNLNLNATYSDNFRRLSEQRRRFFERDGDLVTQPTLVEVVNPDGTPGIELVDVPISQLVEVEPPDNVIGSASLRGATVYDRPGLTGIVQGGVRISAYADTQDVNQRLAETVDAPLPGGIEDTDSITFGISAVDEVFIDPDIAASATARLVPDLLFFDAAAVAQQQALSRRSDIEQESAGRLDDQATFIGGSLSPYVFREFGRDGTLEARYRYTNVFVANENFRQDAAAAEELGRPPDFRFSNDSVAHEGLLEFRSGDLLDRISFALRGVANSTEESGSDVLDQVDLERLSAAGEVGYALNRSVTLTGELGYDEVSLTQTDPRRIGGLPNSLNEDELSGVFWNVGFIAVPGRKTRLSMAVGERFGGTLIEIEGSYRPSPRVNLTAAADRQLETGTQDAFRGFGALNSRTLRVVDDLADIQGGSAQRLLEQAVSFQSGFNDVQRRQAGAGAFDRYRLGAVYNNRRTQFGLSAYYTKSDNFGRSNEISSLNFSARRQLTRRTSVNAQMRAIRNEGVFIEDTLLGSDLDQDITTSGGTTQLFGAIGAAYRLGPRFSLTGRVYRSQREGEGTGTRLDYEENAVSAGVSWTF
ncbi:hypothetical protein [Parvularcula oceani]|uniref:hypothetical protein n=1 Tax=Parvularcula oceani TaxID=1247963 RepID=UPI0004E1CB9A|nr:hypothetical protein [Parvularcula oceani]